MVLDFARLVLPIGPVPPAHFCSSRIPSCTFRNLEIVGFLGQQVSRGSLSQYVASRVVVAVGRSSAATSGAQTSGVRVRRARTGSPALQGCQGPRFFCSSVESESPLPALSKGAGTRSVAHPLPAAPPSPLRVKLPRPSWWLPAQHGKQDRFRRFCHSRQSS